MGTNTKKLKRSKVKHPNLKPTYNLKTRKDLIDFDYLHKLNEAELDFLNKFVGEAIVASFDSEDNNKNLYKNDKDKRKIYTENNARNRCILTRKKAAEELDSIETLVEKETKSTNDWLFTNNARNDIDSLTLKVFSDMGIV